MSPFHTDEWIGIEVYIKKKFSRPVTKIAQRRTREGVYIHCCPLVSDTDHTNTMNTIIWWWDAMTSQATTWHYESASRTVKHVLLLLYISGNSETGRINKKNVIIIFWIYYDLHNHWKLITLQKVIQENFVWIFKAISCFFSFHQVNCSFM
jgi:hypothetical protein